MTPLQGWALLVLVLAIGPCILWLAHEIKVRTRTPTRVAPHQQPSVRESAVRIRAHQRDEPYDHEKHGL
ncbi:hypothetical protein ACFVRD_33140 [Streptomyces sp. NPDC057908]|uniref:hypothetical protein n=1 Tax=Streptomyces sp. NPDC057908 TaxID=3346276 RepID=UPI0036F07127